MSGYRIPTSLPEGVGTITWDSTTLVLVEAPARRKNDKASISFTSYLHHVTSDHPCSTTALLRILARDSGGGRARGLLRVWPLWEAVARRLWPVVEIPRSPHNLFAVHFTRNRGESVSLPDRTVIAPGDAVGELHLNNRAFLQALTESGRSRLGSEKWAIVPMFRDDLRALARWIESGGIPQPIKAIRGVTVLGRGAVRVGFTMLPRDGELMARLDRLFLDGLLIIYTPEGGGRLTAGRTAGADSQVAWMSTGEILRRYGSRRSLRQ